MLSPRGYQIDLQDYHHKISDKLNPLLQKIRKQNINSIYQMSNLVESKELLSGQKIFNPEMKDQKDKFYFTMNQFSERNQKIRSTPFSQTTKNFQIKNTKILRGRSQQNTPTPVLRANSKIKKHLISQIDFNEIQSKLYKKPQNYTRYQEFYDRITQRKQSKPRNTRTISPLSILNDVNQQRKISTCSTSKKKKFWTAVISRQNRERKVKAQIEGRTISNWAQLSKYQ